ncbi:hypothetical protein BBP40_004185 [Aspergillus hancockii]|nr:hypothetical protein BBP40_004185 [Aspergillus hancockii]
MTLVNYIKTQTKPQAGLAFFSTLSTSYILDDTWQAKVLIGEPSGVDVHYLSDSECTNLYGGYVGPVDWLTIYALSGDPTCTFFR